MCVVVARQTSVGTPLCAVLNLKVCMRCKMSCWPNEGSMLLPIKLEIEATQSSYVVAICGWVHVRI
jgi:hypothetical protein